MQHLGNSLSKDNLCIIVVLYARCTAVRQTLTHNVSRRANLVLQIDVSIMFQQQLYDVCVTVSTGKHESRPPDLWETVS